MVNQLKRKQFLTGSQDGLDLYRSQKLPGINYGSLGEFAPPKMRNGPVGRGVPTEPENTGKFLRQLPARRALQLGERSAVGGQKAGWDLAISAVFVISSQLKR